MGYREDQQFRFVARNDRDQPFSEFLNDVFTQIPLDQTCEVNIKMFGKGDFNTYERAINMHTQPLVGSLEINFMSLFYRGWKSPTFDAAQKFVECGKYDSILVTPTCDDDSLAFGILNYQKLAISGGSGKL